MSLCAGLQMGSLESPTTCPVTCVPASVSVLRSSWMQLCSSSDACLRLAVKGCSFCGWDTQRVSGAGEAGQAVGGGGQPAHEKEEEKQCQARAGKTAGHRVKAEEEGSVEVDGQLQARAVRIRQEGVALLCSELSFSFPSPGLSCRFSEDACETQKLWWGWRGTAGR